MVNIDKVDRIVVTSNSKMETVIQWYLEHKDLEFIAPVKKGFVELQEEELGFSFEWKNSIANITVYPYKNGKPVSATVSFDYNPSSEKRSNIVFHCSKEYRQTLKMILAADNTLYKESLKYHALMLFMAYYREYITVDNTNTTTHNNNSIKPNHTHRTNTLNSKIYVLKDLTRKQLGVKGTHASPSHEFEVRGFYRHYKSGKVVWIDGFTKCKGKGDKQPKNYKY